MEATGLSSKIFEAREQGLSMEEFIFLAEPGTHSLAWLQKVHHIWKGQVAYETPFLNMDRPSVVVEDGVAYRYNEIFNT